MPENQSITLRLREFAWGDKSSIDRLMPAVYSELRKLAEGYLRREHPGHTLQPTALVHEAYLKLTRGDQPDYRSRAHFLGVAAHAMRQILIDHARSRNTAKRGGGLESYSLDDSLDAATEETPGIIAVNDALDALESKDATKAKLIEMRFFGGLTAEESAEVLNLSVEKVRSELRVAQAWLERELTRGSPKK